MDLSRHLERNGHMKPSPLGIVLLAVLLAVAAPAAPAAKQGVPDGANGDLTPLKQVLCVRPQLLGRQK